MTKDKDIKTVVPALQFPEFRDTEGWKMLYGSKVFEQISNKNHNSDLPILAISQEHGAIPRDMIDYNVVVTDKSIESYKVVDIDDFIISLRSFQGGIEYSSYRGICSPAYIILRKKIDLNNQFFKHYFKSYMFIQDLNKNLEGIRDGKMVSYKQFSEILLPVPTPNEQSKIADCLGSLDDLISAVTDKIEALKEHKKGLMQQLFPADGKTTPTLRFPEFQNAGEWRETILGKYIEIKGRIGYRGYTTNDIVEKNNGAISLSPTNITDNGELVFDKCTYISWEKYDESPEIRLEKGYVVLVKTGSSYGKSAIVKTLPEKATINPQIVVLKPQKIDSIFLSLLISHSSIQKQINETVVGGAIPTLSQDSISKFKILIPKVAEQKAVADFLSSVDDLISAETDKLDQLKAHKKGLMQQLFPTINE